MTALCRGDLARFLVLLLLCALGFSAHASPPKPELLVASKPFTESYLLSEMLALLIEEAGEASAVRKFGLGGPQLVVESLTSGSIDVEVDYTGALAHLLLPDRSNVAADELERVAAGIGMKLSKSLGFNNTYALAVRTETAQKQKLRNVSDLANHTTLRAAFTPDFLNQEDGFYRLQKVYGISLPNVRPMQHALAYAALANQEIDLTDAYTTDGSLSQFALTLLIDDRSFFPTYHGIIAIRSETASRFPKTWDKLRTLEGKISDAEMTRLNAEIDLKHRSIGDVAREYLLGQGLLSQPARRGESPSGIRAELLDATLEHLGLVLCALLLSCVIGIPIGVMAVRYKRTGRLLIALTSLLQTIPSLALLCFLIPLFGIGARPTIFALFLYGLLPVSEATTTGLLSLDIRLLETAKILGLSRRQRLYLIELPLASRAILSGIKTTAVINVASATIAAMIGAGGYGRFITSGLAMNDVRMILMGAVPTAIMAVLFHFLFDLLARVVIPTGLRIGSTSSA